VYQQLWPEEHLMVKRGMGTPVELKRMGQFGAGDLIVPDKALFPLI
jgi:hypothetical protein